MIEQKPSSIGEAPSLDDIASSSDDDRVGQVDFSAQLGAEERSADEATAGSVSLTRSAGEHDAEIEPDVDGPAEAPEQRSAPLILPPAKVDEALAAEAARIRREVAEARGETVAQEIEEPDGSDDLQEPQEPQEVTEQVDQDVAAPVDAVDAHVDSEPGHQDSEAPAPTGVADLETHDAVDSVEQTESAPAARPRFRRTKPEPVASPAPEPAAAPVSERLQIQDVASLDEIAEEVAAAEAAAEEAAARAEARADSLRRQSEEAAASELEAASAASLAAGPVEDVDDLLGDDADDLLPPAHVSHDQGGIDALDADDELAVDQSVADVAASVIASMQAIGEANERHLEAVELEAARRCELLTAQAELDAELIRLHARREAHAIISAARMRAGEDLTPVETDQLSEIGETFSRFAESIETTIAPGPASPDTTRKS